MACLPVWPHSCLLIIIINVCISFPQPFKADGCPPESGSAPGFSPLGRFSQPLSGGISWFSLWLSKTLWDALWIKSWSIDGYGFHSLLCCFLPQSKRLGRSTFSCQQGRSRVARGPFTLLPVSKQTSAAKICLHLVWHCDDGRMIHFPWLLFCSVYN